MRPCRRRGAGGARRRDHRRARPGGDRRQQHRPRIILSPSPVPTKRSSASAPCRCVSTSQPMRGAAGVTDRIEEVIPVGRHADEPAEHHAGLSAGTRGRRVLSELPRPLASATMRPREAEEPRHVRYRQGVRRGDPGNLRPFPGADPVRAVRRRPGRPRRPAAAPRGARDRRRDRGADARPGGAAAAIGPHRRHRPEPADARPRRRGSA